jgi:hypothetical protein
MNQVSRVSWNAAISPLYLAANRPPPPIALPGISLFDRFADEIAEHGDIALATASLHISEAAARFFFERICRDVGESAS